MKDETYAVLNEANPKDALFPIERKMRTLSMYKYTCVYALLDCCREQFSKEDIAPPVKVKLEANSKGEKSDAVVEVNQESNKE